MALECIIYKQFTLHNVNKHDAIVRITDMYHVIHITCLSFHIHIHTYTREILNLSELSENTILPLTYYIEYTS